MARVPANIAEGFHTRGKAVKARVFNISERSPEVNRHRLIVARDLRFADTTRSLNDPDEVGRMLRSDTTAVPASRFSIRSIPAMICCPP
jgi:hypothetical protein